MFVIKVAQERKGLVMRQFLVPGRTQVQVKRPVAEVSRRFLSWSRDRVVKWNDKLSRSYLNRILKPPPSWSKTPTEDDQRVLSCCDKCKQSAETLALSLYQALMYPLTPDWATSQSHRANDSLFEPKPYSYHKSLHVILKHFPKLPKAILIFR